MYTDSLSGLQALLATPNKNPAVRRIKALLRNQSVKTSLKHVSAHKGIQGNELADKIAKNATQDLNHINLPAPPSYVKSFLKSQIIPKWQLHWDTSTKGRYTYSLIPKVSLALNHLEPCTTAFLTGHGPFSTYLYRFRKRRDQLCDCGEEGSPQHAYFNCNLTKHWHIRNPPVRPDGWLSNILTRKTLLNKLTKIHQHLTTLSNLT